MKIQSLIKLKNVKRKIKMLVQFIKNYDFYNQVSVQQHFGLLNTPVGNNTQRLQIQKFTIQNQKQVISKNSQRKLNSKTTLQKKLSFYTRTTKQSPLIKDRLQSTRNDKSQEYTLNTCQFDKYEAINIKSEISSINF
ncbi:hypothetical protein TTHERM_001433592 (macronuclear) [Tetrahymena thermophila SB210]|uniref:Uncharacterized protein n=1 Tax=Tetrahymena thermophila (strain SB210) TaxID=312017 RepID=W7XKX5_TETTS|nr:hypothetical protein TTHERM_001433592 [Tetrahymena thermophila SB210]EWS75299.1 hypothetical protein TTHERM_001433592 [Tetrahymena thermophila SB210]|eukprot:XP_012652166.1 hypothetical protein TTHERM_001433592 [Tetrahymena thermophila SB210]